jgi:membrane protease YdiL (CAAX protease family)
MDKVERSNLRIYFIFTYVLFWVLLIVTGILISLKAPVIVQDIMKNVCAWSPTFVLIILFKKLLPDMTFVEFIKNRFGRRINPFDFIVSLLMQVLALTAAVGAYLAFNDISIQSIRFIDMNRILPVFLISIAAGPMGEELGWRGYALEIFQKRHSPLRASLILGLIWGFWHTPLWFFSGFVGVDLLIYIGAFLLGIVSTSVLITFFYNKGGNVLIAIWIHFWFNFLMTLVVVDLVPLLASIAVIYFLFALVIVASNLKYMTIVQTHAWQTQKPLLSPE